MKNKIILSISAAAVIGLAAFIFMPSGGYTMAQVAEHNSAKSCWSAINGNVYDLTGFISEHRGGEDAILKICGKDGSDLFNNQHGGQQKKADVLATFKIGLLAE